jgi:hypothetical protein
LRAWQLQPLVISVASTQGVAGASSATTKTTGNCNYSFPNATSLVSWSGWPTGTNGQISATLHVNNGQYDYYDGASKYGGSNEADATPNAGRTFHGVPWEQDGYNASVAGQSMPDTSDSGWCP